jgi:gamma-glutamyltranspeptidase/glutathione hydrolase
MTTPARLTPFAALLGFAAGIASGTLPLKAQLPASPSPVRQAVATVHPLATDAALAAFASGGNAVDAAIAAALTLGIADSHNSGIGGGCFILIHAADGTFSAIDGREIAPAAAHRDLYILNGKLDEKASKTGSLASAVPGALAAYDLALKKHGRKSLADLLNPAADLAERGFPIDEVYARKLDSVKSDIASYPASAAIFLKPDGSPLKEGDILIQSDLAKTYRAIAAGGLDWFYRGPFARQTESWMNANGGITTAADFSSYQPQLRDPIRVPYRGHDIVCMPPPSSGGVHVAQILQIMEHFPISTLPDSDRVHVITEAMKLAFADRAYWLGDPDFAKVPRGLVSPEYAATLANQIDMKKAADVKGHNFPPRWEGDVFGKHTTHLSTADSEGNWVALTQTINTAFGSKVVIPGTGVLLNNEMDDFSIQPGVPNAFKLIGAEANAVAAGKRPLSSMSPTLVLRDGRPILTVGAAGGPTIITQTLLAISNIIDHGMKPAEALAAPRFHHQWAPAELKIEKAFGPSTLKALSNLGHTLSESPGFGACQAILWDAQSATLIPAHDPRVPGKAAVR